MNKRDDEKNGADTSEKAIDQPAPENKKKRKNKKKKGAVKEIAKNNVNAEAATPSASADTSCNETVTTDDDGAQNEPVEADASSVDKKVEV